MKGIKIQIKNRYNGRVLFEFEKENNTIKDTVEEAVRQGANLGGAILTDADLTNANLRGAILTYADLSIADLSGANLGYADLFGATLSNADLTDANLNNANLFSAILTSTILNNANLEDAILSYANLNGAILDSADNIPYVPLACPSDGAFIGWKKVWKKFHQYLVKLEIPEDAKRSSATTNKCRCDKAKVLAITDICTNKPINEILNTSRNTKLLYKVGEMVYPDSFDENRWDECSNGIHFFINKQDAINY